MATFKNYFLIVYDENETPAAILETLEEATRFFEKKSKTVMSSALTHYFRGDRDHIRSGSHRYTLAKIKED